MQTLVQTLKEVADINRWRQWAMVLLASVVILVSTCGSAQAAAPNSAPLDTLSPPKAESMYPYKDTDMDTSAADAKADRMIREANQRIQQGYDKPLGQQVEEVGQSAQQAAKNIGQSTQRAAENAAENARGLVDRAVNAIDSQG